MPTSTREFRRDEQVIVITESGVADGSCVVLVHGVGMGHRYWSELAETLAQESRVLALDLPGFGDSPEPRHPLSMQGLGDLLADLLDHEGLADVTLVGHSMGTQVVAETAAQRPERVASLVLIAPTVNPRERSAVMQALRLVQDDSAKHPKVIALAVRSYIKAGPRWYFTKVRQMIAHRVELVLPDVTVPTLVIRGEHDRISPRAWSREVSRLVGDGRYIEIPDRAHETFVVGGSRVAELVTAHARGEEVGHRVGRAASPEPAPWLAKIWWTVRDEAYAGYRQFAFVLPPWAMSRGRRRPSRAWASGDHSLPEVVLLPGVYEHWTFLRPLGDALNAAGHRVTVVHGLGSNRRGIAETSARLKRALGRARPWAAGRVIVGHSKGGLIGKHLLVETGAFASDPTEPALARPFDLLGVVAICTPFAGSRRARLMIDPSIRALLPSDETIVLLGRSASVNARIVSVFGRWDPHIPDGSVLDGATNVQVPTSGHFWPLGRPETHRAALDAIAMLAAPVALVEEPA